MWHNFADQDSNAFKEVAIVRHPCVGEYAFGFITPNVVVLHKSFGEEELSCVYVPTNHLYLGDIFLISSKDILKPNLSVRKGIGKISDIQMSEVKIQNWPYISFLLNFLQWCKFWFCCCAEIVISGGTSVPQILSTVDTAAMATELTILHHWK